MELKFSHQQGKILLTARSNRTFMELKCHLLQGSLGKVKF